MIEHFDQQSKADECTAAAKQTPSVSFRLFQNILKKTVSSSSQGTRFGDNPTNRIYLQASTSRLPAGSTSIKGKLWKTESLFKKF